MSVLGMVFMVLGIVALGASLGCGVLVVTSARRHPQPDEAQRRERDSCAYLCVFLLVLGVAMFLGGLAMFLAEGRGRQRPAAPLGPVGLQLAPGHTHVAAGQ
jgi:hypothetical protein